MRTSLPSLLHVQVVHMRNYCTAVVFNWYMFLHSHTGPVGTSAAALEPEGPGEQVQLPLYDVAQDPLVRHFVIPGTFVCVFLQKPHCCRLSSMSAQGLLQICPAYTADGQ